MQYQHQAELDDPAKPYRRVYACPATGKFVKIYTRRETPGFGMVVFRITGSECDETGSAIPGRIVEMQHLVQIASDTDVVDIAGEVEAGRLYMVARAERAALHADAAARVTAGEISPPPAPPEPPASTEPQPEAAPPEEPAPRDLPAARQALREAVLAQAAQRTSQSVALYLTVTQLAAIPEAQRTPDQQLQLLQHQSWAVEREAVEAVRRAKVAEIDALTTPEQIDAYDVTAGWPV